MRKHIRIPAKYDAVDEVLNSVNGILKKHNVSTKEIGRAILTVEEALGSLIDHAESDSEIDIAINSIFGKTTIEFHSAGEEFSISDGIKGVKESIDCVDGDEAQNIIRGALFKAYVDDLQYNHKLGKNNVKMTIHKSKHILLYRTLGALSLALLSGLLLTGIGADSFNENLCHYLLVPVKTMFLNALKAIVAPVVFFSIISCVSGFSNYKELGRVGIKTLISYFCTTLIATFVGIMTFLLLKPGREIVNHPDFVEEQAEKTSLSDMLLDSIVGIVPDNFVKPFLESNMLQLIFLAILCGIAVGMIGEYSTSLRNLLQAFNELFLKIISIIMLFMPIAVYCSITSLMLTLGVDTLLSLIGIVASLLFGIICMMIIYCLLLLIFGRLNPIVFLKKYFPTMLNVFSIAASNPAIPINMEACEKKLGIDKKVYSFSIPLGATINMDGTCIFLAVQALALAKMYGVNVSAAAMLSFALSIIIFSIGAPGVPGGLIICLSALLTQLNVPTSALELVIGISPIVGMFLAVSNCLGDVVVTTIVANSEGLLDKQKFLKNYRSD
ncbi:cation:dicarboxylate symporter family transporter [Pseudobutyrivibrio sp.]